MHAPLSENACIPLRNRGFTEGIIGALAPISPVAASVAPMYPWYAVWPLALLTSLSACGCLALLYTKSRWGRPLGALAVLLALVQLFPFLPDRPILALLAGQAAIAAWFFLGFFRNRAAGERIETGEHLSYGRGRGIAAVLLVNGLIFTFSKTPSYPEISFYFVVLSGVALGFFCAYGFRVHRRLVLTLMPVTAFAAFGFWFGKTGESAILLSLFLLSFRERFRDTRSSFFTEVLLSHPARSLLVTFGLLCAAGTVLLSLPVAENKSISILDAAFTAVSGVCVTGLVVLDTAKDFTATGQIFLLLLIQLGGIGIMTLSALVLFALGKRLDPEYESLMKDLTDTGVRKTLSRTILTICRYTFFVELTGAAILTGLFFFGGAPFGSALFEGIFTAVSAFCNAGFALKSNNLEYYQNCPLVLHTVALLIIGGGIAPAAVLSVFSRGGVSAATKLVFITTGILLVSGTLGILIFEWNGILTGLTPVNKIHNAWFQAVTLRTAGFNSVGLEHISPPAYLLMLFQMLVGGSPGGTAGGVKTLVFAVLFLIFFDNLRGRGSTVVFGRTIPFRLAGKAVTILTGYLIVLFFFIFLLLTTQKLPAGKLIFEAVSGLGTVGLSMNATASLDEVGKLVGMLTMFIGRLGPLTVLTLLAGEAPPDKRKYPEIQISLT